MNLDLTLIPRVAIALAAGGAIGYGFGLLQRAALKRHEESARTGKLTSPWSLIPGAGGRVTLLLLGLVLVQLICPLLFVGGTEWLVSAGLLVGYGCTLFLQLRLRLRAGVFPASS